MPSSSICSPSKLKTYQKKKVGLIQKMRRERRNICKEIEKNQKMEGVEDKGAEEKGCDEKGVAPYKEEHGTTEDRIRLPPAENKLSDLDPF